MQCLKLQKPFLNIDTFLLDLVPRFPTRNYNFTYKC